ncbi:protein containing DUF1592 [Rhodopirellula maiorica SM1]|uniref:Protein containing DUF1592 n=1 Tax=Rhodopirellula maiorica SM1 TaxID=1265738 RepID=M5RLQ0_9BACT|nr:protein containing DUF1592 [Rhodopirellula maiorica SM1]
MWICSLAIAPPLIAADLQHERLSEVKAFIESYCLDCHSTGDAEGGLDLEAFDFSADQFLREDLRTDRWEHILRRIDTRQMPPAMADRPSEREYEQVSSTLRRILDQRSKEFPRVGTVAAIRRLTRLEYQYSVRDLLGIEIDASDYLPKDESSHGFDNITVEELSPTHLDRYLSAAQSISRAAVGGSGNGPVGVTIRQPADLSQETHVAGLPFGTRGGVLIQQHFHQTGDYAIELKLTRDRDEKIEGLDRKHHIDVLVDRKRVHQFTVQPLKGQKGWRGNDYTHADSHLNTRIRIEAGTRNIGVTFPKTFSSLSEEKRQPFDANFNRHRHPRRTPAIYQVSIVGPFDSEGPGKTASRERIFGRDYDPAAATRADAQRMLQRLARRAYRREVSQTDTDVLMKFFDRGNSEAGFEAGIELAVTAILVNPNFLFRIEQRAASDASQSADAMGQGVAEVNDYELASRLSYFLWSSLPDDRLLGLAEQGLLQQNETLESEVQRMLADERSRALVDNFAAQWLYLRNLDSITPDLRLFPDFDDNLRQAFAQETKLLFNDVLRKNRSVLDLISTQQTFLNERLATHYGISGVAGSEFRAVDVSPESHRGGILRHGSILMVTSYATRTSPTIRGNWVLENIFGTPAPPPPPNVPNLKENSAIQLTSVRERLAAHRANPACAACHDLMDPVGFALENFDAVGRWREFEDTLDIDSSGYLPDGTELESVDQLEAGVLARPQIFAHTVTEKLITYALGRAVQSDDGPAIRRIVDAAAKDHYTLSSLITGIVLSDPFRKWGTNEQ